MSLNFTNDFHPSSNYSFFPHDVQCSDSIAGRYILTTISFTYILLVLPLSISILCLGFQQWRQQHSHSSAAIMTHSDFFTLHMSVIEITGVFGYALYYCSSYTNIPVTSLLGVLLGSFTWPAQTLFPTLICVERYLAVVHPITYRSLRQGGGTRIRNITTGCIWLMCFIWTGFVILLYSHHFYKRVPAAFMLILSLIIMVFCSISVVHFLIRPQPGKVGRDRVQVSQSKQRAIRIILLIMGVLWLRFGGNVIVIIIRFSTLVSVRCVGEAFTFVFFLPSSLVLPLLFLHRAGKLPNCKRNTGSE